MLVFVDESGDAGLKLEKGSSRYFAITLVIFEDREEAEAADARLSLLRREMRLDLRFEFCFNKCRRDFREQFFRAAAPYQFFTMELLSIRANYGERDSNTRNLSISMLAA